MIDNKKLVICEDCDQPAVMEFMGKDLCEDCYNAHCADLLDERG